jgi:BlaI family penicillinase repressor
MKHIYIPVEAEQKTKGQLLGRFVNTLYKGSAAQLMMQLLGNEKTSKDELDEIKKMLDQIADKKLKTTI